MVSLNACWKFHEDLQNTANPKFVVSRRPFYQESTGNCYVDINNTEIEPRHPGDMKSLGTIAFGLEHDDRPETTILEADVPIAYDSEPGDRWHLDSFGNMKILVPPPPLFKERMEGCGCNVMSAHWHGGFSTHAHVKCHVENRRCFVKEVLAEVSE